MVVTLQLDEEQFDLLYSALHLAAAYDKELSLRPIPTWAQDNEEVAKDVQQTLDNFGTRAKKAEELASYILTQFWEANQK